MQITTSRRENVLVLQPRGRFDAHAVEPFHAALASQRRRHDEVAVDLNEVEFVDETALAALAAARTELRGRNGARVLASPSHSVRVILELTGRDADFTVQPDPAPAGAALPVAA